MSRKRRRNKKNNKALKNTVEKSVDNLKEQIRDIVPKAPVERVEVKHPEPVKAPQYPEKVQQILDTGEYEIIGNILRKKGADVGFTLSDAFIASLENPKTLASFIAPAQKEEEVKEPEPEPVPEIIPEPEPEKHDAAYYRNQDNIQMLAFKNWISEQTETVTLSEAQREQAREYLDTVEYFLAAIRKQLDEGNILTDLGGCCLMVYTDACFDLRNVFSDFLYEDD